MNPKENNNGESGKNTDQQLVSPTPGEMKENEGKKETASGASATVAAMGGPVGKNSLNLGLKYF